jgi:multiple sugar transport system permease protein
MSLVRLSARVRAVIAMIPCVILFVALQRYYVEGMAASGVKG